MNTIALLNWNIQEALLLAVFKGADSFWTGLRSSFPHAKFKVHHVIGRDDKNMPPRAAVRWSLHGKHDGIWGIQ